MDGSIPSLLQSQNSKKYIWTSYQKEVQGHRQPKVTEDSNNWLYNDPIKTNNSR